MTETSQVEQDNQPVKHFVSIITADQRHKMTDSSNHWKVRTSAIDEIHIAIQNCIETDPVRILNEADSLLEFFVGLLSDQNFKIVLMTLSIVNLVISMPDHLGLNGNDNDGQQDADGEPVVYLSSISLGKHIPRLVGKLADSKNIIRQQAIRALMGIYLIMRSHHSSQVNHQKSAQASPLQTVKGQKNVAQAQANQNNFVPLVLPYLCNSSSWHVREELLNVLIICFLKSKNIQAYGNSVYEFDQYKILKVLLQMLDDSKERIRFTALEAIVAFVSIGNKLSAQEIIYQLGDNSISELIKERLQAPPEMSPYLNENGALELPYLENVEIANQMQVDQILQRRQGLNSGPAGQIKALSSHPLNQLKRGNSSGRKAQMAPPSANSLANAAHNAAGNKRTASANNPKFPISQADQTHGYIGQLSNIHGQHIPTNTTQLHVQLGHSATQAKKNMHSPLFNVLGGVHQATTTAAHSEFGQSNSQVANNQYGSSFRQGPQRQSKERIGSGSSSFLPQLKKQQSSSVHNGGHQHDTPSQLQQHHQNQQHAMLYSPNTQLRQYGAQAGPLQSPGGQGLHGMAIRGVPTSENHRIYSQHSEGSSSFYQHGRLNNYQRKISANSQHHPSHLLSRGSGGTVSNQAPNQIMPISNNLSNHPIHVLKQGRGSQQSDGVSSPKQSQISPLPQSIIGDNDRNLLSLEGSHSDVGYPGIPSSGNVPAFNSGITQDAASNSNNYGAHHPHPFFQNAAPQNLLSHQQQHLYESQTQSNYYSRKNAHSQGSYTQQSTNGGIYSHQSAQQNSNGMGPQASRIYPPGQAGGNEAQTLLSRGSNGEGPLHVTPQRPQQPHPVSQNKVVRDGNTFYSDVSMRTNTTSTSTHMANRLKQKNQMKQLQLGAPVNQGGSNSKQNAPSSTHTNHLDNEDDRTSANGSQQQFEVMGVQRGPIKANRQAVMRKEDSQRSLNSNSMANQIKQQQPLQRLQGSNNAPGPSQDAQAAGLYIDSRKPKRPLGSESYKLDAQENQELNEFMTNYRLPPRNAADQQRNNADGGVEQTMSRKSNFTILSQDAQMHASGVNSELAGNFNSAYGSKGDLTEQDENAANTFNKNYLKTEELTPIEPNPQKQFKSAIQNLVTSVDWNVQFDACNEIRRVCKFHQDLILQHGATLHSIVKQLTKLSDSLRSSLSKIALITIRDMFQFLKRPMESYLDPLVKILLKRGSDTSAFISEEAEAALLTMTVNCSDSKVLSVLLSQQINSKSNLMRLRICQCLCQLVAHMGNNILFFNHNDKLLGQLANYLKDACQEVRAYAKQAFVTMSQAVMGQNDFEKLLQRVLNEIQYKKVKGFLDTEAQHPTTEFLISKSSIATQRQADFVIKTAKGNNGSGNNNNGNNLSAMVANGTPTNGLQQQQQHVLTSQQSSGLTTQTPRGSVVQVSANHVALGQNATKQMRAMGAAKGTLRTGLISTQNNINNVASGQQISSRQDNAESLNMLVMKSGLSVQSAFPAQHQSSNGDLNIKATQIVNPQKIVRVSGRPNLKTRGLGSQQASQASLKSNGDYRSQQELHQQFADSVKEISLKVQVQDWRTRIEQIDALFGLINENVTLFQTSQKQSKMSEVTDSICKLLSDQNAKIQLNTLERFQNVLPSITAFVDANIIQIFTQLCQSLGSMNASVRKSSEAVLCKLYEYVNRGNLVQPMCNEIQYSQSARRQPILIDHLSDYVSDHCSAGQINKLVLPLAYKMLDDSRTEVKSKTEKLVKKLHFLVGNQVIDLCPSNKQQRVQDLCLGSNSDAARLHNAVAGNTSSSLAGGGTFGAVGASNLILQNTASTNQNNGGAKGPNY